MSDVRRSGFFAELRRRNVYRVALAYLVAAWLLVQVAATVFPYLGLPDSAVTFVIAAIAFGFLPAVLFAWAFEITPEGVKRERDVVRTDGDVARSARRLNIVIIMMLGAALAIYGYGEFGQQRYRVTESVVTGTPSIAVLPFENRSANADDVYFVDGVHDDILTSLAKIGSMKVISRTSVEQFKDTQTPMPEIGRMLGVTSILEGGIQRAGERIRINVQLIDAATDEHLWADTYDRELTAENVFAIQSEIATVIANELQATLTPREEGRLAVVPTDDLEAYEAYMLGSQRLQRRSGPAIEEAIEYFKNAVSLDPEFALAHIGLADSTALLAPYVDRTWNDLEPLAREAAMRALEIDPGLGEAYASLGMIEMESGNFELAEQHYQKAIAMSPNYATAYQWYGELLVMTERSDEALEQLRIAVSIDPLSPIINYILGRRQISLGMNEEGRASFKKAIEIDPDFGRGYEGLAILQFQNSMRLDEAAMAQRQAIRLGASSTANLALMSNILASLGDETQAAEWLEEAAARDPDNLNVMFVSVTLSLLRNDVTAAASTARRALESYPRGGIFVFADSLDHLERDDIDGARAVVLEAFPELLAADGPIVDQTNYLIAVFLAAIERRAGNTVKSARLIDAAELASKSDTMNRTFEKAVFDMRVAALRGQDTTAMEMLRNLTESGWTYYALFPFDHDPALDSIRHTTEFQAIRDLWQENLAEQRASLARLWTEAGFD